MYERRYKSGFKLASVCVKSLKVLWFDLEMPDTYREMSRTARTHAEQRAKGGTRKKQLNSSWSWVVKQLLHRVSHARICHQRRHLELHVAMATKLVNKPIRVKTGLSAITAWNVHTVRPKLLMNIPRQSREQAFVLVLRHICSLTDR